MVYCMGEEGGEEQEESLERHTGGGCAASRAASEAICKALAIPLSEEGITSGGSSGGTISSTLEKDHSGCSVTLEGGGTILLTKASVIHMKLSFYTRRKILICWQQYLSC